MSGGLIGSDGLVCCEEHEVALLLAADPRLAGEFARRRLAPLRAVAGETTRENLTSTLAAWLRAPGQRKTIAEDLGVHPQTVRYRMTRLRELFGTALDDPDGRFELELALRVAPYAEREHPPEARA
jgi:DNA-binding PucR family transcriptional regulator